MQTFFEKLDKYSKKLSNFSSNQKFLGKNWRIFESIGKFLKPSKKICTNFLLEGKSPNYDGYVSTGSQLEFF